MSQVVFDDIVASAKSGTQLAADLNAFKAALLSMHSGTSRPPYAQANTLWAKEVSGTQVEIYLYDGANDIFVLTYDPTSSQITKAAIPDLFIHDMDAVSLGVGDYLPIADASDGNKKKKVRASDLKSDNSQLISNATFSVSVAGNALTIALKTQAGNDPSADDPVRIAFRKTPVSDGGYVIRSVTSAVSFVLSSGSSLGLPAGYAGDFHVGFIDNNGSVELAISYDAAVWQENFLVSTTAEGGLGAADDPKTMYSTTARTGVACRLAALITVTSGATAGQWSSAPSQISLVGNNPYQPFKNTIKGWIAFNGTGSPIGIMGAMNFASVTDNGVGQYTANLSVGMPSVGVPPGAYAAQVTSSQPLTRTSGVGAGAVSIVCNNASGVATDADYVSLIIVG